MSDATGAATVVLVHGAWADGSCWSNVILPLTQHALQVIAAPIPLTTLSDDVDALRRVIERTTGPVTLVGHAYAGAVIAAAHHDRVKSLVYVAAFAPDEGETVADVFFKGEPHPEAPHLKPDQDGLIWMSSDGFRDAVAQNASMDQLTIMTAIQRPISVNCIQTKVPRPAWKMIPSWYLVAQEDRMVVAENQRFMANRMGAKLCAHPVDHTPMYTAPEVVVSTIIEAVNIPS
jgi:pimeloyl-ACP methyl ester carboxylesterase